MAIKFRSGFYSVQCGQLRRAKLSDWATAKSVERNLRALNKKPLICAIANGVGYSRGGLLYEKELARTGAYSANGVEFDITLDLLKHWMDTFLAMAEAGHSVPVPLGHTTDPEKNRGKVIELTLRGNDFGGESLFGLIEFANAEAAKLADTSQVSVFSPPQFIDGKGRIFERPIQHVALTDYPVIPGMAPFSIVASLITGGDSMTLSELFAKHKITVEDDADDAKMIDVLDAFIAELLKKPESKPEDKPVEKPVDVSAEGKPTGDVGTPPVIAASLRGILSDNRHMKLDALVREGRISKAVRDDLVEQHCSQDRLDIALSQGTDDGFDALVTTLKKNPVSLALTEKTGPQTTLDPKDNPLLADAEARQKAAQESQ